MESFTFSPNFQIEKKIFATVILARIFFPESSRSIKLPKKFLEKYNHVASKQAKTTDFNIKNA